MHNVSCESQKAETLALSSGDQSLLEEYLILKDYDQGGVSEGKLLLGSSEWPV